MANIEIFPPNPPLREDLTAPVLYLDGTSSHSNNWSAQVKTHVRRHDAADTTLYIANKFAAFQPNAKSTRSWCEKYQARAIMHGSTLVWLAGLETSTLTVSEVMTSLETVLERGGHLSIGVSLKDKGMLRKKLQWELDDYDIQLQPTLETACVYALTHLGRA